MVLGSWEMEGLMHFPHFKKNSKETTRPHKTCSRRDICYHFCNELLQRFNANKGINMRRSY
ncbi:hypothetical protein TcasGA2_TC032405 [Tribolium castaneum]|uniref:Uncharacterized protein n=1 Tax=Tribolium castaneum TaxID=7070 RepID=A0A139WLB9_TRICA|nr:hypothetical protein TcasGA2_TC032405 [Tribolium castaneum]